MQELLTLLKEAQLCKDIIVQNRDIVARYNRLGIDENFSSYLVLLGLDSDTDHLPKGSVRDFWNEDALIKIDLESKDYERSYRDDFLKACDSLLLKLNDMET